MNIEKVFIAGAGLMGSGIAQSCAQAGISVTLLRFEPRGPGKGPEEHCLVGRQDGGKKARRKAPWMTSWAASATVGDMAAAAEADLCIEAVFEKLDLKRTVFAQLDKAASEKAVLASNTSAISPFPTWPPAP